MLCVVCGIGFVFAGGLFWRCFFPEVVLFLCPMCVTSLPAPCSETSICWGLVWSADSSGSCLFVSSNHDTMRDSSSAVVPTALLAMFLVLCHSASDDTAGVLAVDRKQQLIPAKFFTVPSSIYSSWLPVETL